MNWIIVGLGNPGGSYSNTRHNAGFLAIDYIHDKFWSTDWKKKLLSKTIHATAEIGVHKAELIKPQTFMNLSGRSVQKYVKSHEDIKQCIVLHDDVHIPIGTFKISIGKNDGGHNGVTSIIQTLHSKDFIRIRIGIAPRQAEDNSTPKIKLDDFVLGKFTADEKDVLEKLFPTIANAVEVIIEKSPEDAMQIYNAK